MRVPEHKTITMIVSRVPAAPIRCCSSVQTNATAAMMSERIGQTIQKLLVGKPFSQMQAIRSTTRPATTAKPSSVAPRHRAAACPVAALARIPGRM